MICNFINLLTSIIRVIINLRTDDMVKKIISFLLLISLIITSIFVFLGFGGTYN